jgi:folate-binding protein YgfZ
MACYEVSGEYAKSFLQSQFTNDVNQVNAKHGQLNSYCTPKGRMMAIFYICQWHGNYYLIMPADIASVVMQRIKMYVMRAKVTITDRSEQLRIYALFGQQAEQTLDQLNIHAPKQDYETSTFEAGCCIRIPGIVPRYMLIGEESISILLDEYLANNGANISTSSAEYWQWLDIMSGIPMIYTETQEAFVPQMTNLELISGVSFSKGCYPGQEVVARLHYLGNANRRMYRIGSSENIKIKPGDDIYASDSEKDQAIGKVVAAVTTKTQGVTALAVLRVEAAEKNKLAMTSSTGPTVEVMSLPYEIPNKDKNK